MGNVSSAGKEKSVGGDLSPGGSSPGSGRGGGRCGIVALGEKREKRRAGSSHVTCILKCRAPSSMPEEKRGKNRFQWRAQKRH